MGDMKTLYFVSVFGGKEDKEAISIKCKKNIFFFYSLHDWRDCFKRAIVMIKVAVHTIHSTSFSQLTSRGRSQFFFVAAGLVHLSKAR